MFVGGDLCRIFLLALAVLLLSFPACAESCPKEKELVILDTDMVELYDDGIAMLMLTASPEIELLGVTVVAGNTWVEEGAAYALRQLEGAGHAASVPVAMGKNAPLREGRLGNMKKERELFGFGRDDWQGAGGYARPESWRAVYRGTYKAEPKFAPIEQHAVDFIIEQVKK